MASVSFRVFRGYFTSRVVLKPLSELVAFLGAVFGQRHDLGAFVRHQDRVFELGGQVAVERANGPAVELVQDSLPRSLIEHRLDRKAHARANDLAAGAAASEPEVRHTGFLMEAASDAVSLVIADDFEFPLGGVLVDGGANVADFSVRLDGSNADPQRFERHLDQASCFVGNIPDQERF